MAKKQHDELKAGLFVIGAVALLIGIVLWLGAADLFSPSVQEAVFYVPESLGPTGLQAGSSLLVADKSIGRITSVELDAKGNRAIYTATIEDANAKIYADARVQVAASFLGEANLAVISRGTESAGLADREHPVIVKQGGLDSAMNSIADAAKQLNDIAGILKHELNAKQSDTLLARIHVIAGNLESAAKNINSITGNLAPEFQAKNKDSLLAKVKVTADNIATASGDVKDIMANAKPQIAEMLAKFREVNTKVLKIASDFASVSDQVNKMILLNRSSIDEMIDNMTQVSVNLKATSQEVRRAPWRLLYQPTNKELKSQNLYDAASAFASGAAQLDQALGKLKGLRDAYPEGIPADNKELKVINKQLEDTFNNFNKAEQALWKELTK